MLPRGYSYYAFDGPLYFFFAFLIGYILGRKQISLTGSLYKLLILLAMLFLIQVIIRKVRREYFRKKREEMLMKRRLRHPWLY